MGPSARKGKGGSISKFGQRKHPKGKKKVIRDTHEKPETRTNKKNEEEKKNKAERDKHHPNSYLSTKKHQK